jgi:hypothetical protein
MPPRKVGERRRARNADTEEAIDKGPQISVNLVPYNVMYRVFLSQLALIPFFTVSSDQCGISALLRYDNRLLLHLWTAIRQC